MKKYLILIFGMIMILSGFMVSAENFGYGGTEVGTYAPIKQGECIEIKQICVTCSYINITVSYPNSTIALLNDGMSDLGGGIWSYDFCNTTEKGRYDVLGSGDLDASATSFEVLSFEVTSTGKEYNQEKASSYILIILISIFVFLGLIFIGIKLPSSNKSDKLTGYILAVSNLKYVKYTIFGLAYASLVWLSYLIWIFTYAYLDFNFLSSMFKVGFYTLAIGSLPAFILYAYFIIANFIRDQKIGDFLLRGIEIK